MKFSKEEIESRIETKMEEYTKKYGNDFKFAVLDILSLEKMLSPQGEAKQSEVIALSEWNKYHSYPTVRALRQYYHSKESNGFGYCVEYGGNGGGRILINEAKYFEWQRNREKFKK